jgi:hypothetical protein
MAFEERVGRSDGLMERKVMRCGGYKLIRLKCV